MLLFVGCVHHECTSCTSHSYRFFLLPLFTPENLKFDVHFLKSKRSRCMNRSVLSAEQVEQVVGHLVCHANRQHHHLSAKSV